MQGCIVVTIGQSAECWWLLLVLLSTMSYSIVPCCAI
jgi:hypothetical protein